ncbi:MAG: hypothetical protein RR461_00870, partial [Angelakisella sp.]
NPFFNASMHKRTSFEIEIALFIIPQKANYLNTTTKNRVIFHKFNGYKNKNDSHNQVPAIFIYLLLI